MGHAGGAVQRVVRRRVIAQKKGLSWRLRRACSGPGGSEVRGGDQIAWEKDERVGDLPQKDPERSGNSLSSRRGVEESVFLHSLRGREHSSMVSPMKQIDTL